MEFTYRGIKYQSHLTGEDQHNNFISLMQPANFLSDYNNQLNFFIWRGVSYSKNFHQYLGLKREC